VDRDQRATSEARSSNPAARQSPDDSPTPRSSKMSAATPASANGRARKITTTPQTSLANREGSQLVVSIRALKRRLGDDASPEGLIASFKTRAVAEPAL
jgi:hypothetical protein